MLHPRVLAQERRFLLQIERSDAEDKGGEGKREGKKTMDETKKETAVKESYNDLRKRLFGTPAAQPIATD